MNSELLDVHVLIAVLVLLGWLLLLPYTLLPLPLCRIGHEVWRTEKPQDLAAWLTGGAE